MQKSSILERAPAREAGQGLSYRQIVKTWWPLAFSWLLMGVEAPMFNAIVARLADPEINLAAFGGIVLPIALIVEAPVIMLLSASVALCGNRQDYNRIWRFMMVSSAILTVLHVLLAFTPLYYVIVSGLIHPPEEVVEPARLGLMILTPWTWAIAYRRFNQGVMIRYGYSGAVGVGTIVRLLAGAVTLLVGYRIGTIPGAAVGALAQGMAVVCEAVFVGWRVRPILRRELAYPTNAPQLSWRAFYDFYLPLALTSLISLVWQPAGSAALSRMPDALNSLAVWPVVTGLIFLLRSFGVAYNEVVVALMGRDGAYHKLRRFTFLLALAASGIQLFIAATPLAQLYFTRFAALSPDLAELARIAFWFGLPMPALAAFQNWFQGAILFGRRTRAIPESIGVFFATILLVLGIGVITGNFIGLYVGVAATLLANLVQMLWLWYRSRELKVGANDEWYAAS